MSARLGRVEAVSWRIFDRRDGSRVLLRGRMDELTCRDYVLRAPERFQLIRTVVTEESEEVDLNVEPELDPEARPGDGPCAACGTWTWCRRGEDRVLPRPPECDADDEGVRAQARRRNPDRFPPEIYRG